MQDTPAETSSNVEYSSSVHAVKCGVPQIKHLWEICQNYPNNDNNDNLLDQIVAYAIVNPDTEHIYKIELGKNLDTTKSPNEAPNQSSWLKNCSKSLREGENMNCVISGSYALWTLTKMFYGHKDPGWKSNDIDMFIMNRAKNARHSPSGGLLDIVHTTDKTPEEVISNFDLPCCRVAFDMNYTFYVSIHALYSIITRKIKLPRYLKEENTFREVLNRYEIEYPSEIECPSEKKCINTYHTKLVTRMAERIKKYQSRGFSFQWYDTDYVLPWIKQRFRYIDFETEKEPKFLSPAVNTDKLPISNEFKTIIKRIGLDLSGIEKVWDTEIQKKIKVIDLINSLSEVDPKYTKEYTEHLKELYHMIAERIN